MTSKRTRTRWTPRNLWRERGRRLWERWSATQKGALLNIHPGEAFAAAFALGALALAEDIRRLLNDEINMQTTVTDEPEPVPPASDVADLPLGGGRDEAHSG